MCPDADAFSSADKVNARTRRKSAAESKPDEYLLKPINQHILETRLERLIVRKQALRSVEEALRAQTRRAAAEADAEHEGRDEDRDKDDNNDDDDDHDLDA